jgi:hypothetical protein
MALVKTGDTRTDTRYAAGAASGGTAFNLGQTNVGTETRYDSSGSSANMPVVPGRTGVIIGASSGTTLRKLSVRNTAGYLSDTRTNSIDTAISFTFQPTICARNVGSTRQGISDQEIGAASIGRYIAMDQEYGIAVKTLWENLTGLTLP